MTEIIAVLEKIEAHLARIADAASLKVKRATATDKTNGRKRAICEDDRPNTQHHELSKRLGVNIAVEWPKFKAYCQSSGKKYADFNAAFRKWIFTSTKPRAL